MQWVTAGEDCVVIELESFPIELSMQLANNTVYAQVHVQVRCIFRWFHENALGNALLLLLMMDFYRIAVGVRKKFFFSRKADI